MLNLSQDQIFEQRWGESVDSIYAKTVKIYAETVKVYAETVNQQKVESIK